MFGRLPDGWIIAHDRPHGLLEAIKRPTETSVHVIVGHDLTHVIKKILASEAGHPQPRTLPQQWVEDSVARALIRSRLRGRT